MDTRLQDNLIGVQHDYIAPFLWLHGEEDALLVKEIEKIYECGIRSVCLESRVHADFCGDGWWSDVRLIMEECRKRDMRVWILDDKHFPSGYANGIFVEQYKELQPVGMTERHMDICGPVTDGAVYADGWKLTETDEIISVIACRRIPGTDDFDGEVIDISDNYHEGMVFFSLPEGIWRIFFLMKMRKGTQKWLQEFCDLIDEQCVKLYLEAVHEQHYVHLKEYFGNTFRGFFTDEPALHNNSDMSPRVRMGEYFVQHPWHPKIMEELAAEYGTDARKMLVGIWCDIPEISPRIRYSFMNSFTKLFQKNFSNQIGDWCREHGVEYIGHTIEDNNIHATTGNGTGHYFRSLSGLDMAGIDVVLCQIMPGLTETYHAVSRESPNAFESHFYHYYLGKLASSFAHMDARKKGRAMCEIFGAYGWAEGTKIMKYLSDHMLVRGINYFVPHAFSPKPNDPDCPPNFYDSGNNPLYKYYYKIMNYLNRASHLLSDGVHVPACAILYDGEAFWLNGTHMQLQDVAKVLYDSQLDYDVIPADFLDKLDENGCINGEKYPLLVIPYYENMPQEIVEKICRLSIKTVVVKMDATTKVQIGSRESDGVSLTGLTEYIRTNSWIDVVTESDSIYLRYYHYMRENVHIYMFSNEDINNRIRTNVSLSAFEGGDYILYDAFENKACKKKSENGEVVIDLPPYHTVFVIIGEVDEQQTVFEKRLWEDSEIEILEEKILTPVFKISVAKEADREFRLYKETNQLKNVTGYDELPYFSGNIRYEGTFELEKEGRYLLDLGRVGEACDLSVNDIPVGNKIIPPYIFDVSEVLHRGINRIVITVSNHNGYERRDNISKGILFEASGLMGPISLVRYRE